MIVVFGVRGLAVVPPHPHLLGQSDHHQSHHENASGHGHGGSDRFQMRKHSSSLHGRVANMKQIALLVALLSSTAHAATLTATPANIVAQIASAKPGDTVQLAAGIYGQVNVWNVRQAAPGVTVVAAPGAAPVLTGLSANGSTNLIFDGLHLVGGGVTAQMGYPNGAANLTFRNMKVEGADHTNLAGSCFAVRQASNITIDKADCGWVNTGFTVLDSDHVVITNNAVHDWQVDAIDMAGTTNSTVKGNSGTNAHPANGDHPDFIQFWSTATTPTSALDIEGNRYDRGAGGAAQGVFGEDGANVTIAGNALLGSMYNGVSLARTKTATISGNYVQGYPDMFSQIIVRGGCGPVAISGNAAQAISNYITAGETPCTGVTISGNTTVQPAAAGDNTQVNAWAAGQGVAIVAPPVTNPLQSVVDSLNAAIAKLQAQVTTDQASAAAQASATAAMQAQLTKAQADLAAAQQQLAVNAQAFTTIKGAIPGS